MGIQGGSSDSRTKPPIFDSDSDKKPFDVWLREDRSAIICPFCGIEKRSDDKLGRHLVHDHWREIEHATKRVRDMNARQN